MRALVPEMNASSSQNPLLSWTHPRTPVSGSTASFKIQRMCVGAADFAGHASTCPTRLLANGAICVTMYD